MPVDKKDLENIKMYFDGQIAEIEKILMAKLNNLKLTDKLSRTAQDLFHKNISYNDYIRHIFMNNLNNNPPLTSYGLRHYNDIVMDPGTEYYMNRFGFRGKEYSSDDKIIAAGCSHTAGTGLRYDLIWHQQLSKKLNIPEIPNIGLSGGSIMYIVENLFRYFYEFGNPEYILFFAPDLYRFRTTYNPKHNIKDKEETTGPDIYFMGDAWVDPTTYSNRPSLIKTPHKTGELFPIEYVLWINMQYLKMLITYCRSSNIKLIWTTWHMPLAELINHLKNNSTSLYNDFFYIDFKQYENIDPEDLSCHKDVKSIAPEYFRHALDLEISHVPHWGSHLHAHIADEFEKEMYKRGYEK